jgi:hypothetical protein
MSEFGKVAVLMGQVRRGTAQRPVRGAKRPINSMSRAATHESRR